MGGILINRIINYIRGYVILQFTGIDKIRFINLCKNNKLLIWDIQHHEDNIIFKSSINSFFQMKKIKKKCLGKLKIIKREGIRFKIYLYRKHLFFAIGVMIFIAILKMMSLYIWNISFDGNYSYTNIELQKFLNKYDIKNGVKKNKIDCENIEYLLRTNYNDITWVSAEIKGTQLIIHIKENFDSNIAKVEDKPYNIVSDVDGTISSIITRSGTPLVKEGDSVVKGQILVSGIAEVLDDNKEVMDRKLMNADADIYAITNLQYNDTFPLQYEYKEYTGKKNSILQVNALSKSFYLSGFQSKFKNADIVKDYHTLSLTDNFYIPFGYCKIKIKEYKTKNLVYSKDESNRIATDHLNKFFEKLSSDGVEIIQNSIFTNIDEQNCITDGTLLVKKKIGEIQYIDESTIETETTTSSSQE